MLCERNWGLSIPRHLAQYAQFESRKAKLKHVARLGDNWVLALKVAHYFDEDALGSGSVAPDNKAVYFGVYSSRYFPRRRAGVVCEKLWVCGVPLPLRHAHTSQD